MTLEKLETEPVAAWADFLHGVNRLAISLDGRLLAVSDTDMYVRVYEGCRTVFEIYCGSENEKVRPTERIRGLAISPDNRFLYIAAGERVTGVDLTAGEVTWDYAAPRSFGFLIISPVSLDVSMDGDVVAGFDNGSIAVWSAEGILKHRWSDNEAPRSVRFLPDGERIVGTDSFSLCVWDFAKKKRRVKIGLTDRVYGMDVTPCGSMVATRTLHELVIWDLVRRDILGVVPVGPGVPILALHPHERWIAWGEREYVKIADFEGRPILEHRLDVASALSLAFSPSGEELIAGCTMGEIKRLPVGSA